MGTTSVGPSTTPRKPQCVGEVLRLPFPHGSRDGCPALAYEHGKRILEIRAIIKGEPPSLPLKRFLEQQNSSPICKPVALAGEETTEAAPVLRNALSAKRLGRGRWFQDYASRFLRQKVRIKDSRYTRVREPESISRSNMGHTLGGGKHEAYGRAPSLRLRAEWISRLIHSPTNPAL